MAESVLAGADNDVISFNLQDIFDESAGNINVFNEQEVPDAELSTLMDQIQGNFPQILENAQTPEVATTESVPKEVKKLNSFPVLSVEQIEEIASHTVKDKTRKETVWGVKVFNGKEI